jgi:CRP-like cAMP-binding protein
MLARMIMSESAAVGRSPMIPKLLANAKGPGVAQIVFRRGEFIFRQGDAADALFLLLRGRVRLSVTAPNGKEATVALLSPEELFGEQCLLERQTRSVSARAGSDTAVTKILAATVTSWLEEDRQLAKFVLERMAARLARYEESLVHHIVSNSERRLARVLLQLARYQGKSTKPKVIEDVSQELLAEMVGTTRSRINGFMTKFRRLGYVAYSGNRIVVHPSLIRVFLSGSATKGE